MIGELIHAKTFIQIDFYFNQKIKSQLIILRNF